MKLYREPLIKRAVIKEFITDVLKGKTLDTKRYLSDNFLFPYMEIRGLIAEYKYQHDIGVFDGDDIDNLTETFMCAMGIYRKYSPREYNRYFWVIDEILTHIDGQVKMSEEAYSNNYDECIEHYYKKVV